MLPCAPGATAPTTTQASRTRVNYSPGRATCDTASWLSDADSAHHGNFVAALLENEATVKVLRRKDGRVWLMPRNPAYEPIPGDDAQILGKVVGVLRLL